MKKKLPSKKKSYLFILLGIVLAASAAMVLFQVLSPSDAVRFSRAYPLVEEDNVFVYISVSEAADILESGTGILYLGFPECPWCQTYVFFLNEAAQTLGITEIFYASILSDRSNNTLAYRRIVDVLGDRLNLDADGNPRVFVPDISVVKDGVVLGHNNQTSQNHLDTDLTPVDYWTNARVADFRITLEAMLSKILE